MKTISELISEEKNSDSTSRRLAAFLLEESFDMDLIGEEAEIVPFKELVSEIENCELVMQIAERIVWQWS